MKKHINLVSHVLGILVAGFFLTKNLEAVIPSFQGLSALGPTVYMASWIFLAGLDFLYRKEDGRAAVCMELLLLLGFLGTSLGFTEYLQSHADASSTDLGGIKHAFLANAQGILYASILLVVSLWTKQDESEGGA